MGLDHLSAVYDQSRQSGSHLMILLAVATHCDPGGEWVADQPTLQQRARLSRRYVQTLLRDLVHSGELAVTSHHGRGHRSTYRLLVAPQTAHRQAPFAEKAASLSAFSSPERAPRSAFSGPKSAPGSAFSNPPVPPCPSFPPDPQYSLNPPYPPEKLTQETFGLAPAPTNRQARSKPAKERKAPKPAQLTKQQTLPGIALPAQPVSPLPAGARVGAGRGAGGEGPREATAVPSARPLSSPQSSTFRTHLLLEEHAIPLPSPAQIGLWTKTLGGIEPLLDLLRRLIHAGLATKREPLAYIHRVVLERAACPEATPAAPAWLPQPRRNSNPLLLAGLDDRRRELGRLIAAKRGV